jgi:branched-chain amino acid transport system permease protein
MTTSDANTAANTAPSEETGATPPAPAAIVLKKQSPWRAPLAFLAMGAALAVVGACKSWSVSLAILNMCLISAIMAMGLNLQWGYAGLFNAGVMAFTALGGLAAVVVSHPPVWDALSAGGRNLTLSARHRDRHHRDRGVRSVRR